MSQSPCYQQTVRLCTHVSEHLQIRKWDFMDSIGLYGSVYMHPNTICSSDFLTGGQRSGEKIAFGWKFALTSIVESDRYWQKSLENIARRKSAAWRLIASDCLSHFCHKPSVWVTNHVDSIITLHEVFYSHKYLTKTHKQSQDELFFIVKEAQIRFLVTKMKSHEFSDLEFCHDVLLCFITSLCG